MTAPEQVDRGPGFYRREQAGLVHGTTVAGPGYVLTAAAPQNIDGWAWYDNEAAAVLALIGSGGLNPAQVTNRRTVEQRAVAAMGVNATFLAVPAPTAAQNAAQVKALTRQMNGLIRLVLGQLDSAD